jgi:hypothetical protein
MVVTKELEAEKDKRIIRNIEKQNVKLHLLTCSLPLQRKQSS